MLAQLKRHNYERAMQICAFIDDAAGCDHLVNH